ncbi:MAG TPA: hypothetical protein ENG69_00865 [Candidatus Korarchaeota archaeon]|nr:hypothetical protein [Candidatus Korarchaeota archaeon]
MSRLAAVLVAILAIQPLAAVSAQPQACRIFLFEDGWAYVSTLWAVNGGLVEEIPSLPGAEMILATDGEGLPLNATESDGFILVETFGANLVNLSYATQQITYKEGDVWTINVTPDLGECEVWLPQGAILVGMSDMPSAVTSQDNRTIILVDTPAWLSYVIPIPGGVQPGSGQKIRLSILQVVLLTAGIVVIAAAVVFVVLRSRKSREQPPRPPLTYDDIAVLRKLIQMGGEAYLSELRAALGMPKTTLWRRARRLEEAGMISVEKTPQGSLLCITEAGRRVVS